MNAAELWTTLAQDERGLMPAVCVDRLSGAVLMLGWQNQEAFVCTLEGGLATFFSRSRRTLWRKGETSGNTLAVCEVRTDCDGDSLLLVVEPAGPACHTGKPSCFFRRCAGELFVHDDGPTGGMIGEVERVIAERRLHGDERSYTRGLMAAGWSKILGKIDEECCELIDALPEEAPEGAEDAEREELAGHAAHEAADLLFHVLVGLQHRGLPWRTVLRELRRRFGVSGIAEKESRKPRHTW
jgi:phosphoribosyl-AMP cyclohydrolase / phosphoribosyl-ATP pyrophosphohydrolase